MYDFKTNISKEVYEQFYIEYSKAPITQDYAWTMVKNNWNHTICALYKNEKIVGAAIVFEKKLFLNISLFYVPRGYLIDFTNNELLEQFTKYIAQYAKSKKAYCVKIDPYVSLYEEKINSAEGEEYNFYSQDSEIIRENLEKNGYIHQGYKKEVNAYFQPRFTMAVPLIDSNGKFITKEYILKYLNKSTRNYLKDYHEKRGVTFRYSNNKEEIKEFIKIINMTEKKQNISLRNAAYFERIMDSFGERAILFFGEIDINKYINFLEKSLDDKKQDIKFLSKQKEIAETIRSEKGDIVPVSAALVILPSNIKGIRMAEFLYAGNDTTILPNLKVNNGLVFYRLMYCLNNNYHYANLGGVDGSLKDHLSNFKSKFNPLVIEFIGEYDLPVNVIIYKLVRTFLPIAKKSYKLFLKIKEGKK